MPILWSCAKLSKITVKRVEIYCGRCDVIIMDSVVDIQFVKVKVKPKTCNMEWVLVYNSCILERNAVWTDEL